ncbi:hypothetical protein DFH28DRAFT_1157456 [Melampsora americana]|nr:hypothetical protein DFH28DRAFT_1157456 [Melampsora americana]
MSPCPQRYQPYKRPTTSQDTLQDQPSTHGRSSSGSSSRTSAHAKKRNTKHHSTEDLNDHNHQLASTPAKKGKKKHQPSEESDEEHQKSRESSQSSSQNRFDQDDLNLFNGGSDDNHGTNDALNPPNRNDGSGEADVNQLTTASQTQLNSTSRETALPSHMTVPQLQSFNRLATWADLSEDGRIVGRKLCNVTGSEEQFHACIVATLSMRQEMEVMSKQLEEVKKQISRIPRGGCSWKDQEHTELKAVLRSLAVQKIMDGDVQAYTAKENKIINQDPLPFSLYGKVMTAILAKPTAWKKEYLPPRYGVDPDNKSSRAFQSLVSNALKEIRKEFETINIYLPDRKTPHVDAAVPTLDAIIVKLYQKEHGTSGSVLVPKEILEKVGYLRASRYAYVRMQALHWGMNRNKRGSQVKYGSRTLWDVIDEQLEHLRTKSTRYRHAFYTLCDENDMKRIDGNKNFAQLKDCNDFSLPTEAQIQVKIEYLNATHGTEQTPEEVSHVQEG